MCSLLTNTATTAWVTLICIVMTGMTTVLMKFLLLTHLSLLWIHLLCTAKLRQTVNHPSEPMMFHVREYSTFTVQEAWDHGNISWYHQPLVGTWDKFWFLWPMLTCRDCCFLHGAMYIQIGDNAYIASMTNTTNWYNGVFISLFAQLAAHYAHITYDERHSTLPQ
jgi:hypothetical protein